MHQIREILRQRWAEGRSQREVARSIGVSSSAVCDCTQRARRAGLSWPLPDELDDSALEEKLYPPLAMKGVPRSLPDWRDVHHELKRKGVTLQLLWEEYHEAYTEEAYGYSQFCNLYRKFQSKLDLVMRQEHRAGEKMFVDFSGEGIEIINPRTGEIVVAELFVAVLGASNYTYAEACATQQLRDWIDAHIHAYEFFGGVAEITVPDNLKSAIKRPCRYEPLVNATYLEMAQHYDTVIIPARPYKPRDKAKVEAGVLLAQRWILATLRNHRFFSLEQVNEAIQEKLQLLNQRKFQKLDTTRFELFLTLERGALKSLPAKRYPYAEWSAARVNIDYHIEVDRCYYSVPYQLIHQHVRVRKSASAIEILYNGRRIASHLRIHPPRRYSTLSEHMPRSHREHMEWTPSRLLNWAGKIGPQTAQLVGKIFETRAHPEQGYRSCLGILRLSRQYGSERLEAACRRGLATGAKSYRSIQSILANGLDGEPLPSQPSSPPKTPPRDHENLRGADFYH